MITITNAIERVLAAKPTYGEALREGIVNYSSLARKMKPAIEDILLEDVTDGAVMMALRRYTASLDKTWPLEVVHPVKNITVRSDITEMAFESSKELNTVYRKLLTIAEKFDDPFLVYGQGSSETTFDLSNVLVPYLISMTKEEKQIVKYENLSVISVRLPLDTVTTPGVYYPFVKAMAWQSINVYQIISYFTEVNFVIDDKDIDRAFTLMKALAKRSS